MQHNWSKYLRWIITLLIACTAVGLFFGEPLYGLTAGLLAYLWWTLAQAKRLYHWLGNPSGSDEAPQSVGLWGDIFDGLHGFTRTTYAPRTNFAPKSTGSRSPPTPCGMV